MRKKVNKFIGKMSQMCQKINHRFTRKKSEISDQKKVTNL